MKSPISLTGALSVLALTPLAAALRFEMQAYPSNDAARNERCIRNFVAKDQLVVVSATVSGYRGDGQTLNMQVRGPRPMDGQMAMETDPG